MGNNGTTKENMRPKPSKCSSEIPGNKWCGIKGSSLFENWLRCMILPKEKNKDTGSQSNNYVVLEKMGEEEENQINGKKEIP